MFIHNGAISSPSVPAAFIPHRYDYALRQAYNSQSHGSDSSDLVAIGRRRSLPPQLSAHTFCTCVTALPPRLAAASAAAASSVTQTLMTDTSLWDSLIHSSYRQSLTSISHLADVINDKEVNFTAFHWRVYIGWNKTGLFVLTLWLPTFVLSRTWDRTSYFAHIFFFLSVP